MKKKPYSIALVAHLIMLVSLVLVMGADAFGMIPQALAFLISGALAARMGADKKFVLLALLVLSSCGLFIVLSTSSGPGSVIVLFAELVVVSAFAGFIGMAYGARWLALRTSRREQALDGQAD